MSDPIEQVAAKLSRYIWQGTGMALGQGALAFTAHAATTSESRNPFSYVMSWLNPFTVLNPYNWFKNPLEKVKKAAVFSGLEAGSYPFYHSIATHWDKTTPLAEKFMTPIITTFIRPVLEALKNEGFISLYDPNRTRWFHVINPLWLAKNLKSGIWNAVTWPSGAIGDWWYGKAPRSIYQVLEEVAPKTGRIVANGIESTAEYIGRSMKAPSDFIEAIAQATGLPYWLVFTGTLASAGFAGYCLKSGWANITNTIYFSPKVSGGKADAKADAQANGNNFGGVHIHLDAKQSPQPILHAATTAMAQANGQSHVVPPITIVTASPDDSAKTKLQ